MQTKNYFLRGSALAAAIALLNAPVHAATPAFTIERIGLTGNGFASQNGTAFTAVSHLNNAGMAAGYSTRYAAGTNTSNGRAAWLYDGNGTVQLGLSGYISQSGAAYSDVRTINDTGYVAGNTRLYTGTGENSGGTATWLYKAGSTTRIGLTGAGYTSQSSSVYSYVNYLNDSGKVAGYSERFSTADNSSRGRDTWLYNGSATVQIGLTGAGYTNSSGYAMSDLWGMNQSGMVAGNSLHYGSGPGHTGQHTWLYDGTTTRQAGLSGAIYTAANGSSFSQAGKLTESGWLAGTTRRAGANGFSEYSADAWLYRNGTTTRVGLTGTGYESSNGAALSSVSDVNEAGQAMGQSTRYNGAAEIGREAWVYKNGNTQQIGLTGFGHTRSNGGGYSKALGQNETGDIVGYSARYDSTDLVNDGRGQTAWMYRNGSTNQIGLSGNGYTSQDGTALSNVQVLDEAGQVLGYSERFSSADNNTRGQATWFFDGNKTLQIGLVGAGFTSLDGTAYSYSSFSDGQMNRNGQVAGYSRRYNGANNTALGQSAWLFDSATDQTFDLTMDVRADGYAYSRTTYLGDGGLIMGYYESYDDTTNALLGNRAFYFKVGAGLFDLGLLTSDLSLDGWSFLADVISANGIGTIVGSGRIAGLPNATAAYILTPSAVPVPSAVWLMGSALLGLALARRRSSKR